jgi:uncharacterized membrane protein YvlD (DUF360 family)
MRVIFAILANAGLLWLLAWLLPYRADVGGVIVPEIPLLAGGWKTYLVGGVLLGLVASLLRPLLTIIGLPLRFVAFGTTMLATNAAILYFFTVVMGWLNFQDAAYDIKGAGALIVSVAIFTVFNTLYGAFFKRK